MPEVVKDNTVIPPLSTTTDDPHMPEKLAREPALSATADETPNEPEPANALADTTTTEVQPDPEPETKPKKVDDTPPWVKALISKSKNEAAAARAEAAAERAARLEAEKRAMPTHTGEPVEPNEGDYTDPAEYRVAMRKYAKDSAAHEARKAVDEYDKQQRMAEAQKLAFIKQAELEAFLARGREKYPDFTEKCETSTLPISEKMLEAAMDSDVGEDIVKFLGDHPSEARRISNLSDVRQAKEIAKIELQLSEKVAPASSVSTVVKVDNAAAGGNGVTRKAPPPITPVGARNTAKKDPEKMGMDEYVAWVRAGRP